MECERLLRLPDVVKTVGLKKPGIYKMITAGTFPAPIKLGARAVAWPESAVQQWIADRIAGKAAA